MAVAALDVVAAAALAVAVAALDVVAAAVTVDGGGLPNLDS